MSINNLINEIENMKLEDLTDKLNKYDVKFTKRLGDKSMNEKITIELRGCDDSTYIDIEVNNAELNFIKRLSKISKEKSTYDCMPTIEVEML